MKGPFKPATSIDEVIARLDRIIQKSKEQQDPAGYFAALYRKVTIKVKEGIAAKEFEDGPRMEILDVEFANRYLKAYHAWQAGLPTTDSWKRSFELTSKYWPIVLQHLLMGMNAHINLDLGIAAAQVSHKKMYSLENDFNKINEVLASLVDNVQQDLASIWPTFRIILKLTGRVDNLLTDFSMKLARDGAWKFALKLSDLHSTKWEDFIFERDKKVANTSRIVTSGGFLVKIIVRIIRLGERGSVAQKIQKMQD